MSVSFDTVALVVDRLRSLTARSSREVVLSAAQSVIEENRYCEESRRLYGEGLVSRECLNVWRSVNGR